jgi:hypothetical protein
MAPVCNCDLEDCKQILPYLVELGKIVGEDDHPWVIHNGKFGIQNRDKQLAALSGKTNESVVVRMDDCPRMGAFASALAFCLRVMELLGILRAKKLAVLVIARFHFAEHLLRDITSSQSLAVAIPPYQAVDCDSMASIDGDANQRLVRPENRVGGTLQRHYIAFELLGESPGYQHYIRAPNRSLEGAKSKIYEWERRLVPGGPAPLGRRPTCLTPLSGSIVTFKCGVAVPTPPNNDDAMARNAANMRPRMEANVGSIKVWEPHVTLPFEGTTTMFNV